MLDRETFVERLKQIGAERYHDKHPFHRQMHEGTLSPDQLRMWAANRYYYQKSIPMKDAAILSNLPDREMRRRWIKRIIDHDGTEESGGGGLEMWFALARAVGLDDDEVRSERLVQPGTRFAVDAYVTFARTQPWLPAVASSLTELFAPTLMTQRLAALLEKYPWISRDGLDYFRARITIAPKDAAYALEWVCERARTAEAQAACLDALRFKCDVLWAVLDATQGACGAAAG
jgi:pyrroloquinoline-quinone synthase